MAAKKNEPKKVAKIKKVKPISVDYSKYEGFIDYGETVQFLNPHTGLHTVIKKGLEECPFTGKKF